jgi:hypothetical protein
MVLTASIIGESMEVFCYHLVGKITTSNNVREWGHPWRNKCTEGIEEREYEATDELNYAHASHQSNAFSNYLLKESALWSELKEVH